MAIANFDGDPLIEVLNGRYGPFIEIDTVKKSYNISKQEAEYFIFSDKVSNSTYNIEKANINILMKNGDVIDITSASGQFNIEALKKTINKYFLCYPKLK
jgi:hypothetical protein